VDDQKTRVEEIRLAMTTSEKEQNHYWAAFSRNLGILSKEEQSQLKNTCVGVAGTGGVGGNYLVALTRIGIGRFLISDPDTFDTSNLNRQYGARVSTMSRNKAVVMSEIVRDINPGVELKIVENGLDQEKMDEFVEGCDIVLDCLDAYSPEVVALHRRARERKLYVLKGIPLGFGATLLVFSPDGMSFDEYFKLDPEADMDPASLFSDVEGIRVLYQNAMNGFSPSKLFEEYMGPDPFSPFNQAGEFEFRPLPSLCPTVELCSALVSTEVLMILLGRRAPVTVPRCLEMDLCSMTFQVSDKFPFTGQ